MWHREQQVGTTHEEGVGTESPASSLIHRHAKFSPLNQAPIDVMHRASSATVYSGRPMVCLRTSLAKQRGAITLTATGDDSHGSSRRRGHAAARRVARRTAWAAAVLTAAVIAMSWSPIPGRLESYRVFDAATGTLAALVLVYYALEVHSCWWANAKGLMEARSFVLFAWFTGLLYLAYPLVKTCLRGEELVHCSAWREDLRLAFMISRDVCTWFVMARTTDLCRRQLCVLENAYEHKLRTRGLWLLVMFLYTAVAVAATVAVIDAGTGGAFRKSAKWLFALLAMSVGSSLCVIVGLVSVSFRRAYFLAVEEADQNAGLDYSPELAQQAVNLAWKLYIFAPVCLIWIPLALLATWLDLPGKKGTVNYFTESLMHAANSMMLIMVCRYVILLTGDCRVSVRRLWTLRKNRAETDQLCMEAASAWTTGHDEWDEKVRELAGRGVTIRALLEFYQRLGTSKLMPHYCAKEHTTADVVRQAIIPMSRSSKWSNSALATVLMRGVETVPHQMVTHTWSNKFSNLIGAVVAHALGAPTYEEILPRLEGDEIHALRSELYWKDKLDDAYWICAFAVDQHASICDTVFPKDVDPVIKVTHPECQCGRSKYRSATSPTRPDGQSVQCEMNKFDDMIGFLSSLRPGFGQVIAVDKDFRLFQRAWCVAELYIAFALGMPQTMELMSARSLATHKSKLGHMRVEDMSSSDPTDKCLILDKIADKTKFNEGLRRMMVEERGLLQMWEEGNDIIAFLGGVAQRGDCHFEVDDACGGDMA